MKRMLLILPFALFAVNARAEEPAKGGKLTDPVEILKKADEACKPVKSLKYTAAGEGLFGDAERQPKVTGSIISMPPVEKQPARFKVQVKVQKPGSSDVEEVTAGCDGNLFYVMDHKNKKVYQDVDPAVFGSFRRGIGAIRMAEFGHESPFGDEINGKVKTLVGVEKVGDEECYHIHVEYSGQSDGLATDWWISTKDFLPRRADRVRTDSASGNKGGGKMVLTGLEINPKADEKSFALVVPDGFTKVEDFAP